MTEDELTLVVDVVRLRAQQARRDLRPRQPGDRRRLLHADAGRSVRIRIRPRVVHRARPPTRSAAGVVVRGTRDPRPLTWLPSRMSGTMSVMGPRSDYPWRRRDRGRSRRAQRRVARGLQHHHREDRVDGATDPEPDVRRHHDDHPAIHDRDRAPHHRLGDHGAGHPGADPHHDRCHHDHRADRAAGADPHR